MESTFTRHFRTNSIQHIDYKKICHKLHYDIVIIPIMLPYLEEYVLSRYLLKIEIHVRYFVSYIVISNPHHRTKICQNQLAIPF
jgi:PleD family two-component response regulator